MPFLRFSRDKRGYEHTYLVHSVARRGKPSRTRILYWYRTPPGVRVGRLPFDEEVRRTIEGRNPGVVFDWEALAATPMPPQGPEHWREKRRAERAAKAARRADDTEDQEPLDADEVPPQQATAIPSSPDLFEDGTGESLTLQEAGSFEDGESGDGLDANEAGEAPADGPSLATPDGQPASGRRRRRRGGRRRRPRPEQPIPDQSSATATDAGSRDVDTAPPPQSTESTSEEPE